MALIPHAAAALWPLLSGDEWEAFKADIAKYGQMVSIIVQGNVILDGRNRYRACCELGLEPWTQEWQGGPEDSVIAYIASMNEQRRQLDKSQRAAVAVELLPCLEEEAKERMSAGQKRGGETGGRGRDSSKEIVPDSYGSKQARDAAAEIMRVNPRYISDAKKLKAEAPDLFEQVKAGELNIPQAKKALRQQEVATISIQDAQAAKVLTSLIDCEEKFATVYADPPWQYGNQATRAATNNHYPTMTVEEIAAMPIANIVADKALLFLWTTNGFLFESKQVIEAWGFEFKASIVWVKPQMGIGNYVRNSHEFLLICSRGGMRSEGKSQMSWVEANRQEHSTKPDKFRDIVDKMSQAPRIELFARQKHFGWTVFGNQIEERLFA